MMSTARCLAGTAALVILGDLPMAALGQHPLLTEDTGTQGAGHYQLELTHELSDYTAADSRTRRRSSSAILSMGVTDTIDFIAGLPHERESTQAAGTDATVKGFADAELAAKWRFYEAGALSFALRPGLGLPTGNRDLGAEHVVPSLYGVMTYARDPWALHVHLGYTRNLHDGAGQRDHIHHASVAAEYRVGPALRLVGDASVDGNADREGHPNVGSMVLGLVYSVLPDLDIDFGYRSGLTDAAPDHAWLGGLTFRF
jgi:hypothetical protein